MHPAEFKPAIPASDRPHILALYRSANGIGWIRSPDLSARSYLLYRRVCFGLSSNFGRYEGFSVREHSKWSIHLCMRNKFVVVATDAWRRIAVQQVGTACLWWRQEWNLVLPCKMCNYSVEQAYCPRKENCQLYKRLLYWTKLICVSYQFRMCAFRSFLVGGNEKFTLWISETFLFQFIKSNFRSPNFILNFKLLSLQIQPNCGLNTKMLCQVDFGLEWWLREFNIEIGCHLRFERNMVVTFTVKRFWVLLLYSD